MVRSPLRYPGGKSKYTEDIALLIPSFEEFREPFLGGGSIFFHTKQQYPDKKFWINDLYVDLFTFWEVAQKDMQSLIAKIYQWKNQYVIGRILYQFLNENFINFNDLERAAAFFIYNRITFSGLSLSGGYSEEAFLKRFTISSIDRLNSSANVLQGASITNLNYSELINKAGKDVFIFLDPPYYSTTTSALYGKNGRLHKYFDHVEFANTMKNCKHKWLITYDNSDYIRELFSFANIIPFKLSYSMRNVNENSSQKASEIFISNYLDFSVLKQSNFKCIFFTFAF